MKQKIFLIAASLMLLISYSNPVHAGEITVNWRLMIDSSTNSDSSKIYDLEFIPGQEQFIIGTGFDVQVRSCEDGSIITKYPFGALKIEFTPDSNRIILLPTGGTVGRIQLRNVNDMSLINEYVLPEDEEGFGVSFSELVVDPVRPLIYTIMQRGKYINGHLVVYRKIQIFDLETLQPVGELTTPEDQELLLVNLAVSKDGKYLAVMNEGISKLMVWSLDSRQKIVDKYIADHNTDKWSDPADVKFSELNTDKIFFTGAFYKSFDKDNFGGLCIYSVSENRIIDSTFAVGTNKIGSGLFTFFENESKMIATTGVNLYILDLKENKLEYNKFNLDEDGIAANLSIYNKNKKYFIGGGSTFLNKFQYQPNTGVPGENPKEAIYPNPTTNTINLNMDAKFFNGMWQLTDLTGQILLNGEIENNENFNLDISNLPLATYFLRISNGKEIKVEKVVKW